MTNRQWEQEYRRLVRVTERLEKESVEAPTLQEKVAAKSEIKVVQEVIAQLKLGYYILVEKE